MFQIVQININKKNKDSMVLNKNTIIPVNKNNSPKQTTTTPVVL